MAVILIHDSLLRVALRLPTYGMFASFAVPLYVSVLGKLTLIVVVLWMIRQLTKRVVIKM